ncbi:Uncharacterized protein APZ42_001584, partial [Daphnia magna]
GGLVGRVAAAFALADPQVGPRGGGIGRTAAGEKLGETGLGLRALQRLPAVGAQDHGALGVAAEALVELPGAAAGFEGKLDLGDGGQAVVEHRLLQLAAGLGREEQGVPRGFGERAFAGLVRSADEGPRRIEGHGRLLMDAVVADGEGEKAHGEIEGRMKGLGGREGEQRKGRNGRN